MILGLNEIFKKKEKVMKHEIDAVITNLEVALSSDYSPTGHFCAKCRCKNDNYKIPYRVR